MVKVLERFLSHYRAIEMLHLSSSIVRDHCMRHTITDAEKACDEIGRVSIKLTHTYHKLRSTLENPDKESSDVVIVPSVDGKSKEELDALKRDYNRAVSAIDKQISVLTESK